MKRLTALFALTAIAILATTVTAEATSPIPGFGHGNDHCVYPVHPPMPGPWVPPMPGPWEPPTIKPIGPPTWPVYPPRPWPVTPPCHGGGGYTPHPVIGPYSR